MVLLSKTKAEPNAYDYGIVPIMCIPPGYTGKDYLLVLPDSMLHTMEIQVIGGMCPMPGFNRVMSHSRACGCI